MARPTGSIGMGRVDVSGLSTLTNPLQQGLALQQQAQGQREDRYQKSLIGTADMIAKQQANARAQAALDMQQGEYDLKRQRESVLQSLPQTVAKNPLYSETGTSGLDTDIGNRYTQEMAQGPVSDEQNRLIGDEANRQLQSMAALKDTVIDPADYNKRMVESGLAQGLGLDDVSKLTAMNKVLYPEAKGVDKDVLKARQDAVNKQADLASKFLIAEGKLKKETGSGTRGGGTKSGSYDNSKGFGPVLNDLLKIVPEDDRFFGLNWTGDVGGRTETTELAKKAEELGATPNQFYRAAILAIEGEPDAWLSKAPEIKEKEFIKYLRDEVQSSGASGGYGNNGNTVDISGRAKSITDIHARDTAANLARYNTQTAPTIDDYRSNALNAIFGQKGTTPTRQTVGSKKENGKETRKNPTVNKVEPVVRSLQPKEVTKTTTAREAVLDPYYKPPVKPSWMSEKDYKSMLQFLNTDR